MLYSTAISFLVLPFNHSRMTPNRMLFGIVAGIIDLYVKDIYGLRQTGQIKRQMGQKNSRLYTVYIEYNLVFVGKLSKIFLIHNISYKKYYSPDELLDQQFEFTYQKHDQPSI